MRPSILMLGCALVTSAVSGQQISSDQFRQDFNQFWSTIDQYYPYWDKKQTDWKKVNQLYSPLVDTITNRRSFTLLLEKVFYEIYDHHASLSVNTGESQRLVPSGTDIWAEYINDIPFIIEVRQGFGSERSGLRSGMQILAYNDIPVEDAIRPLLPKTLKKPDTEARNFALRMLLAGKRSESRKITVMPGNKQQDFHPDQPVNFLKDHNYESVIQSKLLTGNIGYIRINNRLGDNNLIRIFDSVLNLHLDTRAMVLDLRETPSGGNTTVARSILGRFIIRDGFYQKHELTSEEKQFAVKRSWLEIVSPRKPAYTKPLVILVDHWTGSVGEGIAIGFHALKRAKIIGTEMARLNGAVYSFTLLNTNIGFSCPAEKLFHVNGIPREDYQPDTVVDLVKPGEQGDRILNAALAYLNKRQASN